MKTVYEVRVERKIYDDEGNFVASETLFSTESPRPERLLAFAPGQVEAALIDEAEGADVPAADEPDVPAVNPSERYRPAEAPAAEAAPAAKRKRRTKAEIEADRAAEAAKQNGGSAARPDTFGAQVVADTEAANGPATALPAEPVPAEGAPAEVPGATPLTPAAPPPVVEGGTWNPFLAPPK